MSYEKNADGKPVDPAWVYEQCEKFDGVLLQFTAEMRAHFRRKAEEGRGAWENPANAHAMWLEVLAHASSIERAAGHEAHCANFLVFLWMHRMRSLRADEVQR